MTKVVWDQVGDRIYESGVDRGMLYLQDGTAVPWNGLISVDEGSNSELKSFYLDGVKFLENLSPGDFIGKLKAYTYPDEFETVNGVVIAAPGLSYHEQPPKSFNLSYRTRIGNDLEGTEYGYKIHILYNILANEDSFSYSSSNDTGFQPIQFSWNLTGTPSKVDRYRPAVHISIDSRTTPPEILTLIESTLYGTETTDPDLPSITDISEFFGYHGALLVVDYGNGTWSAIDESDTYLTQIDDTTWQIDDADVIFLDADSYTISSTNIA